MHLHIINTPPQPPPSNVQEKKKQPISTTSTKTKHLPIKHQQRQPRTSKEKDKACLIFDFVLLGVFKGDVVFGQASLPLPVLKKYESDLPLTPYHENVTIKCSEKWYKSEKKMIQIEN